MKIRLINVLLIAASLLVPFAATAQETLTWQKFTPVGEGFSVLMASKVSTETSTNPNDAKMKLRSYSSEGDGKFFYVASIDFPSGLTATAANFNAFIGGFLNSFCEPSKEKGYACQTIFVRDLTLSGHTGKQYKISVTGDGRTMDGVLRIYMTKKNFYAMQALNGKEGDASVDKFLNSFTIAQTTTNSR
jgi:hypothetical protein